MIKGRHLRTKVLAGCVALALSSAANALIVDLFSTSQGTHTDATEAPGDTGLTIASGMGSSAGVADATILGGNRDLYVSLLDDGGVGGEARIKVAGGALSFSTDSLARGRGQIQWDGAEGTAAIDHTGLGIALSASSAFALDILFSDGGFNFDITIYSDSDTFTKISFLSNAHATPTTTFIPLAAFNNPFLCGAVNPAPGVLSITCGSDGEADLSSVGAIVVDLDRFGGSTSIDLTLDAVNIVPEPGSVALLGAGLLGLFGVTRRFKKLA